MAIQIIAVSTRIHILAVSDISSTQCGYVSVLKHPPTEEGEDDGVPEPDTMCGESK